MILFHLIPLGPRGHDTPPYTPLHPNPTRTLTTIQSRSTRIRVETTLDRGVVNDGPSL